MRHVYAQIEHKQDFAILHLYKCQRLHLCNVYLQIYNDDAFFTVNEKEVTRNWFSSRAVFFNLYLTPSPSSSEINAHNYLAYVGSCLKGPFVWHHIKHNCLMSHWTNEIAFILPSFPLKFIPLCSECWAGVGLLLTICYVWNKPFSSYCL